jgi:hypothetical protein
VSQGSTRNSSVGPGHSCLDYSLEPAAPAVPSPTENEQHDDDNDEKRRGVHVTLLWSKSLCLEHARVAREAFQRPHE